MDLFDYTRLVSSGNAHQFLDDPLEGRNEHDVQSGVASCLDSVHYDVGVPVKRALLLYTKKETPEKRGFM